jgi:hypothetical protein
VHSIPVLVHPTKQHGWPVLCVCGGLQDGMKTAAAHWPVEVVQQQVRKQLAALPAATVRGGLGGTRRGKGGGGGWEWAGC